MIVTNEATKIYEIGGNAVFALNRVNLRIEGNDFVAIMGPSGSGKSTLLYTVGGLLTPTKGDVTVDGISIYDLSPNRRARFRRENVGFAFQTFELIPYLTALENVMIPMYLSGVSSQEQEERARQALNRVGLEGRALHRPTELSGGEQQRVAIARAIVNDCKILLADEPTGNLDRKTGEEIMELLCQLNGEEGLTVVLVTHDPAKATHANRVLQMIDGRIVEDRTIH